MRALNDDAGTNPANTTTGDEPEATVLHPATEAHIVAIVEGYLEGLVANFATKDYLEGLVANFALKDDLETALAHLWAHHNWAAENSAKTARCLNNSLDALAGKEP